MIDKIAVGHARTNHLQIVVEQLGPTVREGHQLLVVGLLAQGFGQLCYRIGAETILYGMRNRELRSATMCAIEDAVVEGYITLLYKLAHIHLSCTLDTVVRAELVLQRSLVGSGYIKIANAAVIGACNSDAHHIGAYTRHVLAVGNAITQPAGILVNQQLTVHPLVIILRISHGP